MAKIDPIAFIEEAPSLINMAAKLPEGVVDEIAVDVKREYELDKASMSEWFQQMERGIELAKLTKKDKNYPFENASNIKYPLITTAALQFNARAYPAICAPHDIVKVRTHGEDPQGSKAARSERVSGFMSWQLSSEIEEWEEETDKLLVQLPIVGQMYRKIWYDPALGRIRCRIVEAGDFIVNDNVTVLDDAPRCSEVLKLYPQEIDERERDGRFLPIEYEEKKGEDTQKPESFIEQHRRIDLDEDGYAEPYIVTLHLETEKVVRIVADYEAEDVSWETEVQMVEGLVPDPATGTPLLGVVPQEVPVAVASIKRSSYFISYQFMPGMGGGFNGTGLGLLLGDISESINSILNMLLDAGHRSSMGGGFIGSDLRLKGGAQRFKPGEWKMVQAKGSQVRESIVPMTFPEPNAVLFEMFGVLVEAGREIASVKDIMTGDTGTKNMTATTTLALIEQGMMVFTAAYKRIFRSLKREFLLLARMNARTVDPEHYNAFHDQEQMVNPAEDFAARDLDVEPVADPKSVTNMQQAAKAQVLMELAQTGAVDPVQAAMRVMEAADIADIEELAPKPNPMQERMAQLEVEVTEAKARSEQMKAQADMVKAQAEMLEAQSPEDETQRLNFEAQKAQMELALTERVEMAKMAQDEYIALQQIASKERIAALEMAAQARMSASK